LARDSFGIKPLHYFNGSDVFAFSSEIKPLSATFVTDISLNPDALSAFLNLQYIPSPNSVYSQIKKVNAGTWLKIDSKGQVLRQEDFGSIQPLTIRQKRTDLSYEEALKKTREVLLESVQAHLLADVEVGTFLSGGIDSSAIVALMAQYSESPIDTFNVSFSETLYDESLFARKISKKYRTRHHEIFLTPESLLGQIEYALDKMDSPSGDGINSFIVSKAVHENGIKVALSGIGGDEVFAGYPIFRFFKTVNSLSGILKHSYFFRKKISSLGFRYFGNKYQKYFELMGIKRATN
jgi:asparagine synthase (glutamine-hydrolysing)